MKAAIVICLTVLALSGLTVTPGAWAFDGHGMSELRAARQPLQPQQVRPAREIRIPTRPIPSMRVEDMERSTSDFSFPRCKSKAALPPHAPIVIIGDEGFTAANGVRMGSGTALDPYIISHWDIDATSTAGVLIRNTTAHFILNELDIHADTPSPSYGVLLQNVANGYVYSTTISGTDTGLAVGSFGGPDKVDMTILVAANTITSTLNALNLQQGSGAVVVSNTLTSVDGNAVELMSVSDCMFGNNTVASTIGAGLYMELVQGMLLWDNAISSEEGNGAYSLNAVEVVLFRNILSSINGTGLYMDEMTIVALMVENTVTSDGLTPLVYAFDSILGMVRNQIITTGYDYALYLDSGTQAFILQENVGETGLYMYESSVDTMTANTFTEGLYLDYGSEILTMTGNGASWGLYAWGDDINLGTISGNNIITDGVYLDGYNMTVGTIDGNDTTYGIYMDGDGSSIGVISDNTATYGIYLDCPGCSVGELTNNDCESGIYIESVDVGTIINNYAYYGIYIEDSVISTIESNNAYYGLYIEDAEIPTIQLNNAYYGIYIDADYEPTLIGTVADNEAQYGIYVDTRGDYLTTVNSITGNDLSEGGIWIDDWSEGYLVSVGSISGNEIGGGIGVNFAAPDTTTVWNMILSGNHVFNIESVGLGGASGLSFDGSLLAGRLRLTQCDNITVTNSMLESLKLDDSNNLTFTDNTISTKYPGGTWCYGAFSMCSNAWAENVTDSVFENNAIVLTIDGTGSISYPMAAFGLALSTNNTFVSNVVTLNFVSGTAPDTVGLSLQGLYNTVESNVIAGFGLGIHVASCGHYGPMCLDLLNDIACTDKWSCESCEEAGK